MAESTICDSVLPESVNLTLVLVGRTGNGKSATGNSILGRKAFKSMTCASGITHNCELQTVVLNDGQLTINVIDTPGYFDISAQSEFMDEEVFKCIDLAKDGIHAVLLVLSARTRFSQEEEAAVHNLVSLFGEKIVQYMILVFTGGDELEENGQTLDNYLGSDCPPPLMDIVFLCDNGCFLIDNKTKDEEKKRKQVEQLLEIVGGVMFRNNYIPFTDELLDLQKGAMELRGQTKSSNSLQGKSNEEISYDEKMKQMFELVDSRMKDWVARTEQQLVEAQEAVLKAEEVAQEAQRNAKEQIGLLKEILEREQEKVTQDAQENSKDQIQKLEEELRRALKENSEIKKKSSEQTDKLKERLEMAHKQRETQRKSAAGTSSSGKLPQRTLCIHL